MTAASQPLPSTARARPPSRHSIGAATERSRSIDCRCRFLISLSASRATEPTRASVVGWKVAAGPLMSTIPISRPSRGSRTGAAAHVHPCRLRTKCSAEWTCTGAREASAVPIALVPVISSDQAAPSARQMSSARRRIPVLPWRHSTRPSTSVTTMICCEASAMLTRPSLSSGITSPSVELRRRCSTSSSSSRTLWVLCSGSIPLRSTRSHEAPISARGAAGIRSPAILASRARWTRRLARPDSWAASRITSTGLVSMPVSPSCLCRTRSRGHRPHPAGVGAPIPQLRTMVATLCNSGDSPLTVQE